MVKPYRLGQLVLVLLFTLNLFYSPVGGNNVARATTAQAEFRAISAQLPADSTNLAPGPCRIGQTSVPFSNDNSNPANAALDKFKSDVEALVAKYQSQGLQTVSLVIKDQATQLSVQVNADMVFPSASLYKLFVLWKLQEDIEAGLITDDTEITLVDYDTEVGSNAHPRTGLSQPHEDPDPTPTPAPTPSPPATISVSDARRLMITLSDNSAAWSLANVLGWNRIDAMLNANHFSASHTSQHNPTTSASEITRFFEGIYSRNLDPVLAKADYDLMLSLLRAQMVNIYLPQGFPPNTAFAHKTGSEEVLNHDAGIIFTPDGRGILITVLLQGDTGAALGFMQEVARLTWRTMGQAPLPRYFPQTGKTLADKFLEYWLLNGGLETFGYPVSEARVELNRATGKPYLTQWFERTRFELHPENAGTPFEVELGLLGVELCSQVIKSDPAFLPAAALVDTANPASHVYFPPTGHNLNWGFLAYWKQHGGLARFGYPISEEHQELDPESGKLYTVQWFERARFEYHPEHAGTPYEVELGLVGKQALSLESPSAR